MIFYCHKSTSGYEEDQRVGLESPNSYKRGTGEDGSDIKGL